MTVPAPPLLFLDVDGPLIPFGGPPGRFPHGYPEFRHAPGLPGADTHPLLSRLDPAHGARLAALPCTLVWATTWEDDANEVVAPRLGLPPLPVVHWPEPSAEDERDDARHGLHQKTRTLVAWAAARPFAWVDDEPTAADRAWVADRHPAPALLHRVDPRTGLTAADMTVLRAWLSGPGARPAAPHV